MHRKGQQCLNTLYVVLITEVDDMLIYGVIFIIALICLLAVQNNKNLDRIEKKIDRLIDKQNL
jgi:low affinity Fe/Cu permease